MDLDLGCVASFAVLVDEGHYGRAAARLHLTSPALTKRIQRLEHQVGVRLVERGPTGSLRITPAGHRLAPEARALLAHAERVRAGAGTEPDSTVRLGLPAGTLAHMGATALDRIRRDFVRDHPGCRLLVIGVPFPELTLALTGHRVDVLLSGPPVRSAAVECTPLPLAVRRVGMVGRDHPLAGSGPVHAEAFAELPILHNPDVPAEWMAPFTLADVLGTSRRRLVAVDVADAGALARTLGTSDAVAVSLELVQPGPGLHTVQLLGAPPVRFHAAWLREDRRSLVRDLLALLRVELTVVRHPDRLTVGPTAHRHLTRTPLSAGVAPTGSR